MPGTSNTIPQDIAAYLKTQEEKTLLRFITCGSVDDGKSTLIGRLLWDSKLIFEDQLATLQADSKRVGTQGGDIDYALLVDGLQAEREQGITIDVAYRFFSTDKRKFIVADTPGHEQYTRNMATGASTASLAIVMVDARKGVLTQTMRHSYLVSLLGITHVILAINKMDLVEYSQATYSTIKTSYEQFATNLNFQEVVCIPVSALRGDNIFHRSPHTDWFHGPTIMGHLETVDIQSDVSQKPFRMPVQWVNRPNLDFRGFSGTIASGQVRPGDIIVAPSSGKTSQVTRIVTYDGDLDSAETGQSVTLLLQDEIDISRGELLSAAQARPTTADQFEATIIWMHDGPLLPGRKYLLKAGTRTIPAQISELKYKVNVNTLEHLASKTLKLNEVGICNISLDHPISFDPYRDNRQTGAFILIDHYTNATIAAGVIDFALRRADNIHWQSVEIHKDARATLKGQKPFILWFTGLSGAGKSTVANMVEKKLHSLGRHTYLLDGDNVRHGLNRDLGFTDVDRVENIRRVAETAKLMVDAGLIVLVSFISPFRSEREMARMLVDEGEFLEVFIDTPLEICELRDVKGLYKKARAGQLKNFTGIDSPYERPDDAEITIEGATQTAEQATLTIVKALETQGLIPSS
ncbi:MAG: sulfate adenylyltransferase subunit CysN [Nitrospirales bacterium]|nr:sulfate adenylyltransferase subunit CysN [Nitrospiraceae bacterium]MDR4488479.1 sulfate adenylyltransferase subunit CysN [Nitrospirales bacterium]